MGGRNVKNAEESKSSVEETPNKPLPKDSEPVRGCQNKHWIGVRVVDEQGKRVKDVAASVLLTDSSRVEVNYGTPDIEKDGTWRTRKVLPTGQCEISFPELFDIEWWPMGGSPGEVSVDQSTTIADGDCVVSIADKLGFREYQSIWARTKNKDLKAKRPNPNQMVIGDSLFAPDKKDKSFKRTVDQVHVFVVKTKKPTKLTLILVDRDLKPLKNLEWQLLSPVSETGKTGADGKIEFASIPLDQNTGQLRVKLGDPPAPLMPVDPPTGPQDYPPDVIATQFTDKSPIKQSNYTVEWEIKLGSLPDFNDVSGVQARLGNLGFACKPADDDKLTSKAVKVYQKYFLKNETGSGVATEIAGNIRDRHDK